MEEKEKKKGLLRNYWIISIRRPWKNKSSYGNGKYSEYATGKIKKYKWI